MHICSLGICNTTSNAGGSVGIAPFFWCGCEIYCTVGKIIAASVSLRAKMSLESKSEQTASGIRKVCAPPCIVKPQLRTSGFSVAKGKEEWQDTGDV